MISGEDSDAEVVRRSLAEPLLFEELVGRYGARVHGYLARRSPGHADDLLGEVWLVAFEARRRYDASRGEVVGWLFGIARNVLLAHLRAKRRRLAGPSLHATEAVDDWATVDARLDASGVARALRVVLAELPAEERDVLLLVAWEQFSPSEAATVLDIPAGTARSRLHRARTRLTTAWRERELTDEAQRKAIS